MSTRTPRTRVNRKSTDRHPRTGRSPSRVTQLSSRRPPRRTVGSPVPLLPWLAGGLVLAMLGVVGFVAWPWMHGLLLPSRLSTNCAVVVDASGSGENFDPEVRLDSKLPRFLQKQDCGYLDFVPLNGLSDGSHCKQERLDLDPQVGQVDDTRAAMRAEARSRAVKLLDCAREESSSSDVLGAFRKVAGLKPAGSPYQVLVISDMLQFSGDGRMTESAIATRPARQKLIQQLAPVTPDLQGVVLYPTDLASSVKTDQRRVNTGNFWRELFATDRSGHPEMREDYV
jgi:hypothetical protein